MNLLKFLLIFMFSYSAFSTSYSVNLMWINRGLSESNSFVIPEKHENVILEQVILEWAKKNPQAQINIWFDSEFATPSQIENSRVLAENLNKKLLRNVNYEINFRDIRVFQKVKENPEVFSNQIPVYFRADLLRILATLYTIQKCQEECFFVYADWDVVPMNKEQLFDESTVDKLNRFAIVMQAGGHNHNMENSFHIISNSNKNLIYSIETAIVDLNIARAKSVLTDTYITYTRPKTVALQQVVYDSFPLMFMLFYHLEGLGNLKVVDKDADGYPGENFQPYNKELHNFSTFWPDFTPSDLAHSIYHFRANHDSIKPTARLAKMAIPTKVVESPKAKVNDYY